MSSKAIDNDYDEQGFETTCNVRGFMHRLNEIAQAFIDFSSIAPGLIVDMGAAYGVATIPILQKHIQVIACDLEEGHLLEIKKRIAPDLLPFLTLKPGSFPHDYNFTEKSIGAILFSHVLHFLNPQEMDLAVEKLSKWLAPGGKVFIVNYTPYIAAMKKFIPIYEERLEAGIKWPYWLVNNVRDYFDGAKEVTENLPNTMNYLNIHPLTQAFESAGFLIEKAEYLDPEKNHIPKAMLLDGREWSGVIAVKK